MNSNKRTLIIAVVVALCSQFYLNFFIDGFIVTLSVIVLPLFLYSHKWIHPLKICVATAIVSPIFRGTIEFLTYGELKTVVGYVAPDIAFYIAYGVVFFLIYGRKEKPIIQEFLLSVFLSDFIANIIELAIRTRVFGMDLSIVKGLSLIAFSRMLIIVVVLLFLKYFKLLIKKEEHENRYKRLLVLSSSFKSEIYFMQKNMKHIEEVMQKSFKLHQNLQGHEMEELSLEFTKDVHEIKKDYMRVIEGLELLTTERLDVQEMTLKDLVEILITNTEEGLELNHKHIRLRSNIHDNIVINEHYYLMSILRNLVNNSIEAFESDSNSKIWIESSIDEGCLFISVKDNGCGIEASDLEYVFNRGFSTKFNETSGDICRGVGLSIVKDIIKDHFKGDIEVFSVENRETTFVLKLPLDKL